MKLSARELRALADEMDETAAGLRHLADELPDQQRAYNYPDHSVTVRLFELLEIADMMDPRGLGRGGGA